MAKQFEDLEVWIQARNLCRKIYQLLRHVSFKNDLALSNQLKRSSGSIMDNIAEGFERNGNKEFVQFLYIAKGSCGEVRSQLYRSFDQSYLDDQTFQSLLDEARYISSLLQKLIRYLKDSELKGNKYRNR